MDIKNILEDDKFAQFNGIELVKIDKGCCELKMKIQKHHLNGANTLHGGAIFTLADVAFAVASNSYGDLALGVNANIDYFKAIDSGEIVAKARELNRSRKLATYAVDIFHNENLISTFSGTVYIKAIG